MAQLRRKFGVVFWVPGHPNPNPNPHPRPNPNQESAAQRQLLSFTAAAACGGAVRGHALLASSATARLPA